LIFYSGIFGVAAGGFLGWAGRRLRAEGCANDEPLRRAADEVKGIAGHEGNRGQIALGEHGDVGRIDDRQIIDYVGPRAYESLDLDRISELDVLETAEKTVAVACDRKVAVGSRRGGSLDPSHPAVEGQIVGSRQHRDLDLQLTDPHHRQRHAEVVEETLPVLPCPPLGPQAGVHRRAGRGLGLRHRRHLNMHVGGPGGLEAGKVATAHHLAVHPRRKPYPHQQHAGDRRGVLDESQPA